MLHLFPERELLHTNFRVPLEQSTDTNLMESVMPALADVVTKLLINFVPPNLQTKKMSDK